MIVQLCSIQGTLWVHILTIVFSSPVGVSLLEVESCGVRFEVRVREHWLGNPILRGKREECRMGASWGRLGAARKVQER